MEKPFFLLLAMLSCAMMNIQTEQAGFPPDFGDVMASADYVFVGGSLTVACHVKKTINVVGKNLSLSLNDTPVGGVAIDPWAVQLTVERVTLNDSGVYYCWLDEDLVGSMEIFVEYPVRAVQDVSCVVYNWAWMNCSWSLGDYQHPEDIVVSLEWFCKGCKDQLKCPDPHQTYCRWPKIYGSPQYIFNITVENNRTKDAEWTVLPIKSFDVIKPDPVELKVRDRNQSCVELQWSHSEVERIPDMVFGVTQTELPDGVTQTELPDGVTKVMAQRQKGDRLLLCDLHPATRYSFSVKCFPNDGDKGFWSDPATVMATTLEDVPAVGPPITAGSFVSDASGCDTNRTRLVTLFWKAVPTPYRNGVVRTYTLQYRDGAVQVSGDQYSVQLELNCQEFYRVDLFAGTAVGMSVNYTSLEIPPEPAEPTSRAIQEFFVNTTNAEVQAVWNLTSKEGNVTVFWCSWSDDGLCEGQIEWATVQADISSLPLPIKTQQASDFSYGISTSGWPLGITWAKCLANMRAKPEKPVALMLIPGSNDGMLEAKWQNQECSYRNPVVITDYRLHVCERPCPHNSTRVISVPGTQSQYLLTELNPGAEYQVNIQAVARGGEGPLSDPKFEKARISNGGLAVGLGVGLGIGLTIIIAMVLGACCYVRFKQGHRQMDIEYPEIKHPVNNTYHLLWDKADVPNADLHTSRISDPGSVTTASSSVLASPTRQASNGKVQNGGLLTESKPDYLPSVEFVGTLRQLNHRPDDDRTHHMVPRGKPAGRPGETGVLAESRPSGREGWNRGTEAPSPTAAVSSGVGGLEVSGYVQSASETAPSRPSLRAAAEMFLENVDDANAAGREADADTEPGNSHDYVTAAEERPVGDSGHSNENLHESAVGSEQTPEEEPAGGAMETVGPSSSSVLPAGQGWGMYTLNNLRGGFGQGGRDPQGEASAQRPASSPSPPPYIQAGSPERCSGSPLPPYVQAGAFDDGVDGLDGEGAPSPATSCPPYIWAAPPNNDESGIEAQQPSPQPSSVPAQSSRNEEGRVDNEVSNFPPYIQAAPLHNGVQPSAGQELPLQVSSNAPYIQAGSLSDEGESSSLSSSQPSYIQAGNQGFSGPHNYDDLSSTSTSASSLSYKKMEDMKMLVTPVLRKDADVQPPRCEKEMATIPANEADSAGIELVPMLESSTPSPPISEQNAGNYGGTDQHRDAPSLSNGPHGEGERADIGSAVHTGYCRADQLPEFTRL